MVTKEHVTMNRNGNGNWFSKMEEEFSKRHHKCDVTKNQYSSSRVKLIKAIVHLVRLGCLGDVFFLNEQLLVFDQSGLACSEEIRSTAKKQTICQQVCCLPAITSFERLEYLDDDEHILSMIIVGGDLRLKHKVIYNTCNFKCMSDEF
ncbi:abscisic acid receptor PYL8-like [Gossypium australe]|uniref:Abscisic acid receptor PYL8-like n=1 Tax=Gossypium australe TaxID=47621 RepID=A0A5B6VMH3_9ROSI|nr:abscisic acid receptor PYL8-like [Gossypium australe]